MRSATSAVLLLLGLAGAGLARASIVSVVQSQPDMSILAAAIEAAGLVEELTNPSSALTVFAPVDEAFEGTLGALGMTAEQLLNDTALLMDVLSYHVIPGVAVRAAALTDGQELLTLLPGFNVTVAIPMPAEVLLLSEGSPPCKVLVADLPGGDAVGSIIHVIGGVLVPDELSAFG